VLYYIYLGFGTISYIRLGPDPLEILRGSV
jgi:hypothetical protein